MANEYRLGYNFVPMDHRRTKIVATLGPACSDLESLRALLSAGVDVVRINGSHGQHAQHATAIARVRALSAELARPVGILFDLQGPKIRLGTFDGPPVAIAQGATFALSVGRPAADDELPCDYPYLDRDVRVGAPLLIDDGQLTCTVTHVAPGRVEARAEHAGFIGQRKGINLPESDVSAPAISDKDRADVLFAVAQKVDFIAMSFVRRAQDINALRELIDDACGHQAIIAKIEKPQALDNLEAILEASWGVMVARGDLGVELSASLVPMAQKRIIRAARRLGKPVITATQMLDSMTRNPRPTRAEASDVANAVLDGTDAVMLSQETAVGTYPVETVRMMGEIIDAVECDEAYDGKKLPPIADASAVGQVLAHAACTVAEALGAPAIATYTETGHIAQLVSQRRPHVPIVAFAATPGLEHRLCLVWGVLAITGTDINDCEDRQGALDALLMRRKLARKDDHVVLMVGAPNGRTGSTNSIMVHRIGEKPRPAQGLYEAARL